METQRLLDDLPSGENARISHVEWAALTSGDAKRLAALGIDEGAEISIAHRGIFGAREPIALRIGRMTVALRRTHARAIVLEG